MKIKEFRDFTGEMRNCTQERLISENGGVYDVYENGAWRGNTTGHCVPYSMEGNLLTTTCFFVSNGTGIHYLMSWVDDDYDE